MDELNIENYNFEQADYEVLSDYSDGVSEDSVDSEDIHTWATEKLKFSKENIEWNAEDETVRKSTEIPKELQKQDVRSERDLLEDGKQDMKSKSRLENGSKQGSDTGNKSSKTFDGLTAQDDDSSRDGTSKIVLGNCQTGARDIDNTLKPLDLDPHDSTALLCQYCLQDYRTSDAITYCLDCGLYMCASCRRYHQKFVATRGHSVAVQQELIPTEYEEYKPPVVDEEDKKVLRDSSTSPRLDTTLIDSGRYSRPLTPPHNALCGPCQFDGVGEPATHFCQDCGIYMCRICNKFHQKLRKSYEQHSVINQWDCQDFDTFVPSLEAATEAIKQAGLYDFIEQPYPARLSQLYPTLQPHGRFSIKMTSDPWECSVAGIDCFADSSIVLTDENNRNIKLFSSRYQPLGNLELQGRPTDVAIVTNDKIVVFIPKGSILVFVKVHGTSLSLLRMMNTASKYVRIASKCEEIYALCDPEGQGHLWLHILNDNGTVVSFIHLDLAPSELSLVPSLAISPAGGTVYVSDKNHCIFAFGMDGRRIFKHRKDEMLDITDLAADSRSVYVCCKDLASVFRLGYDGRDSSKVVDKTARIASPRTVAIHGNQLLVGLCDSDNIHIYSIAKIP